MTRMRLLDQQERGVKEAHAQRLGFRVRCFVRVRVRDRSFF